MICSFFVALLLISGIAFADDTSGLSTDAPILAEILTEFPIFTFYLGAPALHGVAFMPNATPKTGVRLFIDGVGAAFTLPVTFSYDDHLRGKTQETSFIISPFKRTYGFDFYYQWFHGFYEVNPLDELGSNKPSAYPQLPSATAINYGLNGYFTLGESNYSLAASFVQTERQSESGGAFIVEPFFNECRIDTGGSFVAGSDPNIPQVKPDLQRAHTRTMGAAIGYAHAWIINSFYVTVLGAVGTGYEYVELENTDGTQATTASAAIKANGNASIGFNLEKYIVGFKILADSLTTNVNSTQLTSTTANAQFYFGAKF